MNTKNWRLTKEEYVKERNEILKKKTSVDEWARISLSGELSEREIMTRVMMDNDPDIPSDSYICQLYVCEAYDLSEEFLRDIIYVNSGLALLGFWDKKVIDWVLRLHKDIVKGSTSSGNAFKDIELAVDSGYFVSTPEYHEFLKSFLVEYDKLCDDILHPKMPKIKDVEALTNYYLSMAELANKIINYTVPIRDRLDWNAIKINMNLSSSFVKEHSKITGQIGLGNDQKSRKEEDEFFMNPPITSTKSGRKYTTRHVRKVGRDKTVIS